MDLEITLAQLKDLAHRLPEGRILQVTFIDAEGSKERGEEDGGEKISPVGSKDPA